MYNTKTKEYLRMPLIQPSRGFLRGTTENWGIEEKNEEKEKAKERTWTDRCR